MSILLLCILVLFELPKNSECRLCPEIRCSNVIDYVCGIAEKDGVRIIKKFQNVCHLNRVKCELQYVADIRRVPDILCNIKKRGIYSDSGRRVNDFSVIGAHQACNHTCPTSCIDTYEPVCAKIWTSPSIVTPRVMINHCHVDMLSCAAGVNVTMEPVTQCLPNAAQFIFLTQMASLKSLGLVTDW